MTYEEWLTKNGYLPSTVERGVRRARQIWTTVAHDGDIPVDPNTLAEGRRLRIWLDEGGREEMPCGRGKLREALEAHARAGERARATPLEKKRQQQARRARKEPSYPDDAWKALHRELSRDTDDVRARVLLVLMETGLRAQDVLAISRARLDGGLRSGTIRIIVKGGDERRLPTSSTKQWAKLAEAWRGSNAPTVAALIAVGNDTSPIAGHTPYKRLRARLVDAHVKLELDGRPHLHRLRRTVLVQASKKTGDVELVRQLAGHRSYATTQTYIDEARPEAVGALQSDVRKSYLDEEE